MSGHYSQCACARMEAPPIIDTANAHAYFRGFFCHLHISRVYTHISCIYMREKNYIKKLLLSKHVLVGSYGISLDLLNKLKPLKRHDQAMKVLAQSK